MDEELKRVLSQLADTQAKLLTKLATANKIEHTTTVAAITAFRSFDHEKENFDEYIAQLKQYFMANGITDADRQKSCFLAWVGVDAYHTIKKVYGENSFENENFSAIEKRLSDFYLKSVHILSARFKFWQLKMKPGDSYASWIANLRNAATKCEFKCECKKSYTDTAIRDMIVLHTIHDPVRTAILQLGNPKLEDVIKLVNAHESTQAAIEVLKGDNNVIQEVNQSNVHCRARSRSRSHYKSNRRNNAPSYSKMRSCPGCYKYHERDDCKFLTANCYRCGKTGHIASVCKSILSSQLQQKGEKGIDVVPQINYGKVNSFPL